MKSIPVTISIPLRDQGQRINKQTSHDHDPPPKINGMVHKTNSWTTPLIKHSWRLIPTCHWSNTVEGINSKCTQSNMYAKWHIKDKQTIEHACKLIYNIYNTNMYLSPKEFREKQWTTHLLAKAGNRS